MICIYSRLCLYDSDRSFLDVEIDSVCSVG